MKNRDILFRTIRPMLARFALPLTSRAVVPALEAEEEGK
jgi:hypothetical protein